MAGLGKRFKDAGHDKPKPLIDVFGQPMIQRVVNCLCAQHTDVNFIFIAQKQHMEIGLKEVVEPLGQTILLNEVTEGAACTTLLAKHLIDNENELIIANCDQYMKWDFDDFIANARKHDGCLATFNSTNPHHSYAKVKNNLVEKVAEKIVISDKASAGIYYFKNGSQYVQAAEQMINKNIRTNNEFYICPVYNELIQGGFQVSVYNIDVMNKHMLGTPEELNIFIDKVNDKEIIIE